MAQTYTLTEIIAGIRSNAFINGDVLENSLGEKATIQDNSFLWLTGTGYVSTPVAITADTVTDVWRKVGAKFDKEITFAESIEFLAKGEQVQYRVNEETIDSATYTIENLGELDSLIDREYIKDLYNGKTFVSSKTADETAVEKTTDSVGRKINEVDVRRIHELSHAGFTAATLAERFNITVRMVYYILDGTYWNNVYKEFNRSLITGSAQ